MQARYIVRYRCEIPDRGHVYDVIAPNGAIVGDGFPSKEARVIASNLTMQTGDMFDGYGADLFANYQATNIGEVGLPDGRDQYVLVVNREDDLTPDQARDWLLGQVYRTTDVPGGYFCHEVRAVQAEHSTNKVICTICHRYDV